MTKLVLSKNKGLKDKAGLLIGDALLANPEHPIDKIGFKDVTLGEDGLLRILEGCNGNKFIKKIHLGYVSCKGLKLMSKALLYNTSLQKIKFQETTAHKKTTQKKTAQKNKIQKFKIQRITIQKTRIQKTEIHKSKTQKTKRVTRSFVLKI